MFFSMHRPLRKFLWLMTVFNDYYIVPSTFQDRKHDIVRSLNYNFLFVCI